MKYLTFQYCAFHSLMGRIIDWGTQGDVGHVGLVLDDGSILDAQHEDDLGGQPSGVWIRLAGYMEKCGGFNLKRTTVPVTDGEWSAAMDWANSMIGVPYDTDAIIGIAEGKNLSTPGKLICSGFCSGILTQPDPPVIKYPLARPWRIVTPEQHLILTSSMAPVQLVG